MIPQTVTYPTHAGQLAARPLWSVEVTAGIIQGGALVTGGNLQDWSLFGFDLGTAIWPVIASKKAPEKQPPSAEAEYLITGASATDADATSIVAQLVRVEDDAIAHMEAAAAAGDERAFLAAQDAVDWEARPAEDFLRAIQLALSAGAHLAARNLAAHGAARFPDHSRLAKFAHILAPPRVFRAPARPNAGIRANRDWLMAHGTQYRGQWVALRDGQLLAVGDSLDSIIAQVGGTEGALFTKAY